MLWVHLPAQINALDLHLSLSSFQLARDSRIW
jgi:hypothetical protein